MYRLRGDIVFTVGRLFVPALFILVILSCNPKFDSGDANTKRLLYKDFISSFDESEKIIPTHYIDFKSKDSTRFLISGWSTKEENHIWAEGNKSKLFFLAIDSGAELKITLNCAPFYFKDAPSQSIRIWLNNNFVKEVKLKKGLYPYKVLLKNTFLKMGRNQLLFECAHSKKPSDLNISRDNRSLSVRFTGIKFSYTPGADRTIVKSNDTIIQGEGTVFSYYEKLPKNSILNLKFGNKDTADVRGKIHIQSEESGSYTYTCKSPCEKKLDLGKFNDDYVKISFSIFSKDKNKSKSLKNVRAAWLDLKLFANVSQPKLSDRSAYPYYTMKLRKMNNRNVIYIVFDAFSSKHSSAYGYYRKTTPFFDTLAQKNVLFKNMFCSATYTLASTASLFSSTYACEHGLRNSKTRLADKNKTFIDLLNEHDISTYMITGHGFLGGKQWGLNNRFKKLYFHKKYGSNANSICSALDEIFKSNDKKKKFIYIHINPPHAPYFPPKGFRVFADHSREQFEIDNNILHHIEELKPSGEKLEFIKSLYDSNLFFADNILKNIYLYLSDQHRVNKSLIFISSDHGEAFMEHGAMGHNSTLYDEMIHVPFLVLIPKRLNIRPKKIEHLSSLIDVAPTILDIFGIKPLASFKGKSLLPLIFNNTEIRSFVYSEIPSQNKVEESLRGKQYKIINNNYKIMLFDIENDPDEKYNLTSKHPILTGYLLQKIQNEKDCKNTNTISNIDPKKTTINKEVLDSLKELGYMK